MNRLYKFLKRASASFYLGICSSQVRLKFLVVCIAITLTSSLQGQTLNDYLLEAAKNNPGLQASYAQYQAASEQVNQVSLPNPELQAGLFLKPMERFMGNQTTDIRFMQMFPWKGMLASQKEEAYQMGQATYFRYLEKRNQLFLEIKTIWLEMLVRQGEINLIKQTLDYLKQEESLILINYQVGTTGPLNSSSSINTGPMPRQTPSQNSMGMSGMEQLGTSTPSEKQMGQGMSNASMSSTTQDMQRVLQVKLQLNEEETTLKKIRADLEVLKVQFNQLLHRPIESEIVLPEQLDSSSLPYEKEIYLDKIKEGNPMLAMYEAEKSALDQQARMAVLDGLPMLGAGLNYMIFSPRTDNGMPMGGENMVMPMVTLNLPIYRKKIESKVKQTALLRQSMELSQQETENRLTILLATTFRNWEDSNRNLELYKMQMVLIKQQLDLAETGLSTGKSSLLELLQLQKQLIDYQRKVLIATYQGQQSLAQLDALIQNTTLPSN